MRRIRRDTRSARPARTASRYTLRLGNGDRKRMPEHHPSHVARCALQEKGEGLCPVGGIENEAVLRVPSGRTIVSGGEATCEASSNPASKWPTTPQGCAPPPGIQRRRPSAPARRHAWTTASGSDALAPARAREQEFERAYLVPAVARR